MNEMEHKEIYETHPYNWNSRQKLYHALKLLLGNILTRIAPALQPRPSPDQEIQQARSIENLLESNTPEWHFDDTSSIVSIEVQGPTPAQQLRDTLSSFPPTAINPELAEFLECFHNLDVDPEESDFLEMSKWIGWLREIFRWQKVSRQMEPVKDLLRKSMLKIDAFRSIQVNLLVLF